MKKEKKINWLVGNHTQHLAMIPSEVKKSISSTSIVFHWAGTRSDPKVQQTDVTDKCGELK